jgi:hypothetical protein
MIKLSLFAMLACFIYGCFNLKLTTTLNNLFILLENNNFKITFKS